MNDVILPRRRGGRQKTGAISLHVRAEPDLVAALNAWIAEQHHGGGKRPTRPEALRRLAKEALIGMGLLEPPKSSGGSV